MGSDIFWHAFMGNDERSGNMYCEPQSSQNYVLRMIENGEQYDWN